MIKVYMFENCWRLSIGNEIWQFPTLKELINELETICKIKEKYGKI
jgi:hypothetical protein